MGLLSMMFDADCSFGPDEARQFIRTGELPSTRTETLAPYNPQAMALIAKHLEGER